MVYVDFSDYHLWASHLAKERGGGEGGHQGGQEHHLHPHCCAVACPEICDDQQEMKMFLSLSMRMFLWMFTRMFWTCPWECHRKAFQCSWRQSSPLRQKTGNDRPRWSFGRTLCRSRTQTEWSGRRKTWEKTSCSWQIGKGGIVRPGHPQQIELFSLERLFWSHKRSPVNLIVKKYFSALCYCLNLSSSFLSQIFTLTLSILFSSTSFSSSSSSFWRWK